MARREAQARYRAKLKEAGASTEESPSTADDNPVNIEVVAGEPANESFADRLKSWARGEVSTTTKPKPRGDGKVTPTELGDGVIVPLLSLAMMAVPRNYRMTEGERAALSGPIARILLRHLSWMSHLTPDVVDVFAIIAVLVAYARRIDYEAEMRAQANHPPTDTRSREEHDTNGQYVHALPPGDPLAQYVGGPV